MPAPEIGQRSESDFSTRTERGAISTQYVFTKAIIDLLSVPEIFHYYQSVRSYILVSVGIRKYTTLVFRMNVLRERCPSLRSGRAVKEQRLRRLWLSMFDGRRSYKYTPIERAWTFDCLRSEFLLLLRLFGRKIVCYCFCCCRFAFAP